MSALRFAVLVPVKPLDRAKSRMRALPDARREALAAAFALDTVEAALAAGSADRVLVVTDDTDVADRVRALGAEVVPDGVGGDLNGSLTQAAAEARRRWPALQPVVVCADLPGLSSADLEEVLREVTVAGAVVPDARGDGTTVYTAPWDRFAPAFGAGSFARHLAQGARPLPAPDGARLDVDEPEDLARAVAAGVGRHTRAALGTPP